MPKLTATQQRVMDWMGKGWSAHQTSGDPFSGSVSINGKRACGRDTINALIRHGLVEATADSHCCFVATQAGRADAPVAKCAVCSRDFPGVAADDAIPDHERGGTIRPTKPCSGSGAPPRPAPLSDGVTQRYY